MFDYISAELKFQYNNSVAMTLTETAKFTKRFLLFAGIFSIALIIVWIGSIYSKRYLYSQLPQVQEQPDLKFALLPKLKFIDSSVSSLNYSYRLDTPTGALPENLPSSVKIYAIPQLGNTFLAADKAREIANKFGFDSNPEIISANVHKFTNLDGSEFNINITTGNFSFRKSVSTQSATETEQLRDTPLLSQNFRSFLDGVGLLPNQLRDGDIKTEYQVATESGQPDTANLSIWQGKIDDLSIVTDKFKKGLIEAVVAGSSLSLNNYLSLDYTYWPIDTQTFAIYPIKSAEEALTDLRNGEGAIVTIPNTSEVSIDTIYLAYFLSKEYPEYLQPVFVFQGKDFIALIQAVKKEYVKN